MSGVRVRDFFYVGLPKVVNGTVSLGINLFLAHHFAPGEFGPISFCLNYLLLMDALVGSALDLAVSAKITGGGEHAGITRRRQKRLTAAQAFSN